MRLDSLRSNQFPVVVLCVVAALFTQGCAECEIASDCEQKYSAPPDHKLSCYRYQSMGFFESGECKMHKQMPGNWSKEVPLPEPK